MDTLQKIDIILASKDPLREQKANSLLARYRLEQAIEFFREQNVKPTDSILRDYIKMNR